MPGAGGDDEGGLPHDHLFQSNQFGQLLELCALFSVLFCGSCDIINAVFAFD